MKSLEQRNGIYSMRKRVPIRYRQVEERKMIRYSLNTDSRQIAEEKARKVWDYLIATWELRLEGDSDSAERRYQAAINIAKSKGFTYLTALQVVQLPLEEVLKRIEAATDKSGKINETELAALAGTVDPPALTLSGALDAYWPMARDMVQGKSDLQIRHWRNPRMKAFKNFIDIVGDLELEQITPDTMNEFRSWWMDRIEGEGVTPNSANKDFTYLTSILRKVNRAKGLNLTLPFDGLKIKEGKKYARPPFSDTWIREKLLKAGAMDGLNTEARAILLGMINTGYRPSEGACLTSDQIRLDHNIPHIIIQPVGRTLKNHHSERTIPLVGVSLESFRAHPQGFPRYGADSASLSGTINKFLTENGLRETPKHSVYCLRHSFEDRLLAKNVPDRLAADLMGHALVRERYGSGASLEQKFEAINAIAF
ncbi:DUF6538 domain-containing protein [Falsihalocynthiibacter sp. BN13B15]